MQSILAAVAGLSEPRSNMNLFYSIFAAMSLLVQMGWIALLACVSMNEIAQRKPQNRPYGLSLFVYGLGFGGLFTLLAGWRPLGLIAPQPPVAVFMVMAGFANSNLPYGHYVTEITRYTDWAYRV